MWIPGFGKHVEQEGNRGRLTLKDTEGNDVRLGEQVGDKPVVLVFYPKAGTPVCTKQLCSLREGWGELMDKANVFGISYDSREVLKRWKEQEKLPFPLLSDAAHDVAKKYGVAGLFANARVTFVIGKDGKIKAVINKINATNHAGQILEVL